MAKALFMSSLLLLSMQGLAGRGTAADSPGDLHVRLVGGDRETAVLELGSYPGAAGRLEVAQLVFERRLERPSLGRQPDCRVAAGIGPHLPVVGGGLRGRGFARASHAATLAGRGKTAATLG